MMPSSSDYNQHLLAYLQAWRQLLEPWTTMTPGMPFPAAPSAMPGTLPGVQVMPPMPPLAAPYPPMPPSPTDYTQQLFGYLQAWRHYLEQMTGAASAPPQPVQPTQPNYPQWNQLPDESQFSSAPNTSRPPQVPVPPDNGSGSQISSTEGRGGSAKPHPPQQVLPPANSWGNQYPMAPQFNLGSDRRLRADRSAQPGTSPALSGAPSERLLGSAFPRATGPVGSGASVQPAPRSLFSSPAKRTRPATSQNPGQG
jgi:hypothetical protein